ncbi:hypothetical protein TNCT_219761 [Trichonephila clavata]|uniref:Uncharacterized protein n=1 Tax=Trichonephila clavata TaxID=2740835 RepID=A0A8X6L821_TRICU|nr:hypothetical protein TNCT_219761 [Trichonephila clavata]
MTKPIAFALDMLPLDGESHSKWQSNPTESRALGHVERVCEDYLNKCFDYLVESLPERPVTPLEKVDPSVLMTGAHVEVTSRLPTPPLMTRCNKSTQAYSSHLELGKRLLEQPPFLPNKKLAIQPKTPTQPTHTIVLFVPDHHPMLKSGMCRFILQPHPVKNVNK